jgi:predicted DNA-binding transcriptional regulator AlpA
MTKRQQLLATTAPTAPPGPQQRARGAGYFLGPHKKEAAPLGAKFLTAEQVCDRYGGRSTMWLHRRLKSDPAFPKPTYLGRLRLFPVAELDAYDLALLQRRVGGAAA